MIVFSGNSNPSLALCISDRIDAPFGSVEVGTFRDGETKVEILDNVRGQDVFVVQSTSSPTNDNLMELLAMIDALRLASAKRITAVIPYLGYARQDRRPRPVRSPITARLVAKMIAMAGADRVLTMDIHADQIMGFFDIPVDNVYAWPAFMADIVIRDALGAVVVSPDVGGVVRARAIAKRLDDADLAIIDKRRPAPNMAEVMNIIGDVEGRTCIIVDDMVDTAGTLCQAAAALKAQGATGVLAYCTHPVLSVGAVARVLESQLDELVVSDTIPLVCAAESCEKIRVVSVADTLAETIRRISNEESVTSMFN